MGLRALGAGVPHADASVSCVRSWSDSDAHEVLKPTMFSVYGHLKMGHLSCLEDFETHRAALA